MKKYKKIVLAYSGGLDTTAAIPWLKEHTGAEIIAAGVNVGQPEDFDSVIEQAMSAGASKALFIDATKSFAEDYILPSLWANALYEGKYPLPSALSRPIIVQKIIELARAEGADAIAHGCTGKGNDQVRFEYSLIALAPDMDILAPARVWGFTREDSIKYATDHGIKLVFEKSEYSIDENIWGRAIECGVLEDAWNKPTADLYKLTTDPINSPDIPTEIIIEFEKGTPVAINGKKTDFLDIIEQIGIEAGKHGVGRLDMIENRVVGLKSREVYECPAALTLIEAHKALESIVLTKEEAHFKPSIELKWGNMMYSGQWHTPLMDSLNTFIKRTQKHITGTVRINLYKGNSTVTGLKSPHSLYDEELATYGVGDIFDHKAAEGFLKLLTMETSTLAQKKLAKSI